MDAHGITEAIYMIENDMRERLRTRADFITWYGLETVKELEAAPSRPEGLEGLWTGCLKYKGRLLIAYYRPSEKALEADRTGEDRRAVNKEAPIGYESI
jgi:hypothetical protein